MMETGSVLFALLERTDDQEINLPCKTFEP